MSQESRDERLGLTGLSPEQRRQRVEELERDLAQKSAAAKAKLEAARARKGTHAATAMADAGPRDRDVPTIDQIEPA
jgi:hypothetical protein